MQALNETESRREIDNTATAKASATLAAAIGVAPPEPEWGAMIAESKDYMRQAWWVTTMPALAIVLTGTALSLIGDGLAQRLGQNRRSLM